MVYRKAKSQVQNERLNE